MMRYAQQVLQPGEQIIAIGRFHWLYSAGAYLWLVLLGVFIIGIVIFLVMIIRKWTTEIVITTDRLIFKTGWIARHAEEISLTRIEEVALTQTVMGRILGYGSLRISGTGTSVIHLPSILANPVEFRRALAERRDGARRPS
jgi:uncharacterized membrane protein YdbT with pleckstrin-like domain